MGSLATVTRSVAATTGVLLIAAGQTSPDDAISNIAGWLSLAGADRIPILLASPHADTVATVSGVGIALAAFAAWIGSRRRQLGIPAFRRFIPLHKAAHYVARDSIWASQYDIPDENWVIAVQREMQRAFSAGEVHTRGHRKQHNEVMEDGVTDIPPEFWASADWNASRLATQTPTHQIMRSHANGGGVFQMVTVDEEQLRKRWPQRSLWARLRKQSPVQRIDYRALFREQDRNYDDRLSGRRPGAFLAVFGEDS